MRAAVIVANFYRDIAEELLSSCRAELEGAKCEIAEVLNVPGALEIPFAMLSAARRRPPPDLMVALGCVIRGETYHFEVVANASAAGILQVQLQTGIPAGNGVLTVDDRQQAKDRMHGKGAAAASAALGLARIAARAKDGA